MGSNGPSANRKRIKLIISMSDTDYKSSPIWGLVIKFGIPLLGMISAVAPLLRSRIDCLSHYQELEHGIPVRDPLKTSGRLPALIFQI